VTSWFLDSLDWGECDISQYVPSEPQITIWIYTVLCWQNRDGVGLKAPVFQDYTCTTISLYSVLLFRYLHTAVIVLICYVYYSTGEHLFCHYVREESCTMQLRRVWQVVVCSQGFNLCGSFSEGVQVNFCCAYDKCCQWKEL